MELNQPIEPLDKLDMSAIYPDYHDLIYLLLGMVKYSELELNTEVKLNNQLRNILEELLSSYRAESILYDDLEGYINLKVLFRHGVPNPIKKWTDNYLINVFLTKFEYMQDSYYLDTEVKYFLESLQQQCNKVFSPIDKVKYIKYGRDYNG